jgi:hypothetical protein
MKTLVFTYFHLKSFEYLSGGIVAGGYHFYGTLLDLRQLMIDFIESVASVRIRIPTSADEWIQ